VARGYLWGRGLVGGGEINGEPAFSRRPATGSCGTDLIDQQQVVHGNLQPAAIAGRFAVIADRIQADRSATTDGKWLRCIAGRSSLGTRCSRASKRLTSILAAKYKPCFRIYSSSPRCSWRLAARNSVPQNHALRPDPRPCSAGKCPPIPRSSAPGCPPPATSRRPARRKSA
jgi:hypothetical protein